ncbi:hypothetical protein ES705_28139 [subsurface metagenome]
MSTLSKHNRELTNGIGKCSVPMWQMGCPAGFCDNEAFGKRPKSKGYIDSVGEYSRLDGKYAGYVPGLACPGHGGPRKEEVLNLCEFCKNHPAECESNPKFGTGKGKDNVYECDSFEPK